MVFIMYRTKPKHVTKNTDQLPSAWLSLAANTALELFCIPFVLFNSDSVGKNWSFLPLIPLISLDLKHIYAIKCVVKKPGLGATNRQTNNSTFLEKHFWRNLQRRTARQMSQWSNTR